MRWIILALLSLPVGAAEIPFGAHATLRGTGNGKPAPEFVWFKDGVEVFRGANFVIPSATQTDAATYVCRGSNGIGPGAASTPLVVVVAQAPVIVSAFPNITIVKQSTHTLSVTAYGPAMTYQWKKGGRIIAGQALPTYTITKAKPPDAGVYECEVSNAWGTVASKATVTVR